MASKVWFITGTSKGFGRVWAEAALARGDRVAATARDVKTLQPLVARYGDLVAAIALDVTDKAAVAAAVAETIRRFGRIDVAVNNAGYGLFGTILGFLRCGKQGGVLLLVPVLFAAIMNPFSLAFTWLQAFAGLLSFFVSPLPINAKTNDKDDDD